MNSDLEGDIAALAPNLRGRLTADAPLAPFTWFRVGGPAEVLFSPADEDDLAYVLERLPDKVPVTVIGRGSNLIVRDGGVAGVVVRLGGREFGAIKTIRRSSRERGAAAPDAQVARAAAGGGNRRTRVPTRRAGLDRRRTADERGGSRRRDARKLGRGARRRSLGCDARITNAEMGFSYRHSKAPDDVIFTRATFQGRRGDPVAINTEMERITAAREASQPIREKTGGSTFKNPSGYKAWQLIDAAGCRGLVVVAAQVSMLHCNFLINRGGATAADIEALGEEVRRRVKASSGVELEWEIRRLGAAA